MTCTRFDLSGLCCHASNNHLAVTGLTFRAAVTVTVLGNVLSSPAQKSSNQGQCHSISCYTVAGIVSTLFWVKDCFLVMSLCDFDVPANDRPSYILVLC